MSDKREGGAPREGRPKGYGTQIFDSKNMKGRQAEAGRRVQPSATGKHANDPPDGGTIGGLPLGGGARGGRRGSVGGRRGSQDNGRRGSVDAGKGRRGSVDSGDAEKDKDKEKADSTGAASAGLSEDRDSIIEKQQRRAIALSQKGDWPALEHCVKTLERMVPDPPSIPPLPYHPLRDIVDEVGRAAASRGHRSRQGLGQPSLCQPCPVTFSPLFLFLVGSFLLYFLATISTEWRLAITGEESKKMKRKIFCFTSIMDAGSWHRFTKLFTVTRCFKHYFTVTHCFTTF